jgi:hypothetical protein
LVRKIDIPPKKRKAKSLEHQTVTTIYGGVYDGTGKKLVSVVRGDHCGTISINDDETWNIKTNFASRPRKDTPRISDSQYLIDRVMLLEGRITDEKLFVCDRKFPAGFKKFHDQ